MSTTPRPQPCPRSSFAAFVPITTRWSDNDIYGHINNVTYYSFFDTAVNSWLIAQGALDIARGGVIGLVVETRCNYFAPLAFPQGIEAGIAVEHMGARSVRYRVGIFAQGDSLCAAHGHFVHVYVDRASRKPVPLGEPMRLVLQKIQTA
jgi:acyl-CoA thioester hydrolase